MVKPFILVVEDERMIVEVLRLYLEREGYEVIWAADSAAALDLFFGPATPDLVLLDLMLPRADG
ncbi:MAG: response regulator [Chloroflexi bacterium]|nr:response regulator [Chloroflexota bacterium]